MSKARPVALILGMVTLLAVLGGAYWPSLRYGYSAADTYCWLITIGSNATRYGEGFSEVAFDRIRIGMTRDEVHATLGEPLARYSARYRDQGWRYSLPATRSGHYHQRSIYF